MHNTIFFLIIIILWPDSCRTISEYLNDKMWSDTLPDKLKDICGEEEYRKSQLTIRIIKDSHSVFFIQPGDNSNNDIAGGFAYADNIAEASARILLLLPLLFFGIIDLHPI